MYFFNEILLFTKHDCCCFLSTKSVENLIKEYGYSNLLIMVKENTGIVGRRVPS